MCMYVSTTLRRRDRKALDIKMGCTSSTEAVVDRHTGQIKQKKKLGGQYPGQRRAQNAPYMPDDNEFHADNVVDYSVDKVGNGVTKTATAHFVAYGGGNALVLMDKPNRAAKVVDDGPKKEFIEVTLPANVNSGDVIHVKNQKGQINAIVVPDGMGPGSTFTVEFDTGDAPPVMQEEIAVAVPEPEISTNASQYPSAPVYPSNSQAYGR